MKRLKNLFYEAIDTIKIRQQADAACTFLHCRDTNHHNPKSDFNRFFESLSKQSKIWQISVIRLAEQCLITNCMQFINPNISDEQYFETNKIHPSRSDTTPNNFYKRMREAVNTGQGENKDVCWPIDKASLLKLQFEVLFNSSKILTIEPHPLLKDINGIDKKLQGFEYLSTLYNTLRKPMDQELEKQTKIQQLGLRNETSKTSI